MKNNLKQFRSESGLSLEQLGGMCGITRQGINLMELEKRVPGLLSAYSIATALGKTVYEIWPDDNFAADEAAMEAQRNKNYDVKRGQSDT